MLSGRSLPSSSTLFPVPDHPRFPVVVPTIYRVVVNHDGFLDLDLHVQFSVSRLSSLFGGIVELVSHRLCDVAWSRYLMTDKNSLMRALLSGLYKRGSDNELSTDD